MTARALHFKDLLGTDLPVVQAPMAGVQDSALAIAVCRTGGLGSLPAALLKPAALERELGLLSDATTRSYNVNFFCHVSPRREKTRDDAWRQLLAPYYKE